MDQALPSKALLGIRRDPTPPGATAITEIARRHGVSPLRQMREMWALRRGPGKLKSHEYVSTGVFDPAIPMERKREYVGKIGSYELNVAGSPLKLTEIRAFARDKVMYSALLDRLGFPVATTQAVVHGFRDFGTIPALRNAAAVQNFLENDAVYPLFGKPCEGAEGAGSAKIDGCADGELHLANGRRIDVARFAAEVVRDHAEGFLLQSALPQHPHLDPITGPILAGLRLITVRDENGAEVLYTVWKIPAPDAMTDNHWQSGSLAAAVDENGRVINVTRGIGLSAEPVETHPVSGVPLKGLQIPNWDVICDTARRAHMVFPEFGVVGWDLAIGPDGPITIELNDNPFHGLYQFAFERGIRNPDILPRLNAAAAHSEAILQSKIGAFKARQRAKGRKVR